MASYNELLALIDAYINRNGVQAITGQILNGVLKAMVDQLGRGYTLMGYAEPTGDPGTPDGPESWFASVPGTYTNYGEIQVAAGELALLSFAPSEGWTKNTIYEGFREVTADIDGNVGTPEVGVSYANGVLSFDFRNMKGNPGEDGDPAGFGAVTASVDDQVGTPSVSVSSSGPDTAKNFAFAFHNLKGETGVTSVVATVDNTSGNPQCSVSLQGGQLTLAFTGLKGAQGNTGSSVDYPFTIVNNLTTDDPTQALSAAMGVELDGKVSQLEAKVDLEIDGVATIDKGIVWSNGYVNGTTGTVTASSTSQFSQPVLLKAGEKLSYKTGTQYTKAVVKVADGSPVAVGDTLSGDTIISYDTANATVEYTATEDIYIVITVQISSNEITFTGYNSNSIRSQINVIEHKVDELVTYTDTPTVNIFDKTAASENKYVNRTTGGLATYTGFYATDFIPVDSRGVYFNKGYSGGAAIGAAVYDSNKTFRRTADNDHSVVYQEGDAYVRFTVQTANIDTAMAVAGTAADVPSEYVPFGTIRSYSVKDDVINTDNIVDKSVTEEKIADGVLKANNIVKTVSYQSPNIFDKSSAAEGRFVVTTNGTIGTLSGWYASGYIEIPEGASGMYQAEAPSATGLIGWACYDSTKAFTHSGQSKQITFQEGDAYVRISVLAEKINSEMLVVGTSANVPEQYMPYGTITEYSLKDDVVPFDAISFKEKQVGKNKLNKDEILDGKYINRNTGAVETWSVNAATPFIPVSKKGLYFNKFFLGGESIGAAVYDAQKQYLRQATNPYIYQDGDGYVRYSLLMEDKDTAQVEEGTVGTSYEEYTEKEVIDPNYLPDSENQGGEESSLQVFLPDKIHAVVGDTIQVFFKGIVKSVDALKYNVCIKCSKGSIYHRYWQYTPAVGDAGNYTFQVFVRDDNGNTLASASRTLVVSSAPSSPETVKSVVCVGSSESANGIWPAELGRRLVGTGGNPVADGITNVQLCGTKTKDGFGFVGNSGWSWVDYATKGRAAFRFTVGTTPNLAVGNRYSNNGYNYEIIEISDNGTILCETSSTSNIPQASGNLTKVSGSGDSVVPFTASAQDAANPFWDYANDKLTFIPFANAYCDGHIDALYFLAGTNGLTAFKTDFSNFETYMISFAETLHAEFPSAKLVLVSYCFPSMELMMPGYGANGGWADTYGMLTSLFNEQMFYQEFANRDDYSDFVDYVALAPEVDSDNNFPVTMKDVNTRNNTKQEPYANNTIHAGTFGYLQFADAVYRHFVAKFCQS